MKRLIVFNWLKIKTANKEKVDGIYDDKYQVIGIDPRLGNKKLIRTIIHEILHYLSDTYPKTIKKLSEKQIEKLTKQIFNLIKL